MKIYGNINYYPHPPNVFWHKVCFGFFFTTGNTFMIVASTYTLTVISILWLPNQFLKYALQKIRRKRFPRIICISGGKCQF